MMGKKNPLFRPLIGRGALASLVAQKGPKNLDFQGPPLPMVLVMDLPASKP